MSTDINWWIAAQKSTDCFWLVATFTIRDNGRWGTLLLHDFRPCICWRCKLSPGALIANNLSLYYLDMNGTGGIHQTNHGRSSFVASFVPSLSLPILHRKSSGCDHLPIILARRLTSLPVIERMDAQLSKERQAKQPLLGSSSSKAV